MRFPSPLVKGILLRRYKRFLADVRLEDGAEVTAHCANPGAMLGVANPGAAVWLAPAAGPGRKLAWSWKLTELPGGHFAGIDTGMPNRLTAEALAEGRIPALAGYAEIRPEIRYGDRSRVDFLLTAPDRRPAHVEVKNVHLRRDGDWAEFPDSVTARGAKHLDELAKISRQGGRAVMLYVVQRTDCARMRLAADLDPAYAAAFRRAADAGVETVVHATYISPQEIHLAGPLPFEGPAD